MQTWMSERDIIRSGNGILNGIMDALCKRLNIKRSKTTAYHPQTNGLVERFNGTLMRSLRKLADEREDEWDEYINEVSFAYRTSVQETTRKDPFFLLYGRNARLPVELQYPTNIRLNDFISGDNALSRRYSRHI